METRASYALVGTFVLALMVGMLGFVVWLAKFDSDVNYTRYEVLFSGSVTGLSVDSAVRYTGIPVGTVRTIEIDPGNIDRIRVVIEVKSDTPVKTDSYASLEMQGITGVGYVQIHGGSQDAAPLVPKEDEEMAQIPSKASALEQVFASAPEMVKAATELLNRANDLLNEDNRRAVSNTLANVEAVTAEFAKHKAKIGEVIDDARATFANVRDSTDEIKKLTQDLRVTVNSMSIKANAALDELNRTLVTVNGTVSDANPKIQKALTEIQAAAASIAGVADTAEAILAENRTSIRDFADTGLYELGQLIVDSRSLVASLTQIAQQLERDPASFLFGGNQQGYQAQ